MEVHEDSLAISNTADIGTTGILTPSRGYGAEHRGPGAEKLYADFLTDSHNWILMLPEHSARQ
jgi:hypothetical protein